ncbi:MAG TPA: MmgE/PrpD family protein [Steroidobacteraceae bacterium]|nr:MmgE/PrpD family protein [Steroidobacteraceae bacterium]HRX88269.1 MmgE/PrpD family protein [Steroidobacteraceae bacterium]
MNAAQSATRTQPGSTPTLSRRLAAYARTFQLEDAPADVIAAAKLCILDALGIGFASTTFEFAKRSAAGIVDVAGEGGHAVIGMDLRLPLRDAALLNGILIHGLDFDDTHLASVIHASASAVPVMLSEGARQRVTGRRALAAYLLAVEVDARIGQFAGGWWQKAGFHPTGMVGIFGATLAAAYLREASESALTHAQGLALSMAAGSMEFLEDGTWNKRFHPGWAASSAITAAALAAHGFASPDRAYEGRFGLFRSFLGAHAPDFAHDMLATWGDTWEMRNVAVKPYPVCHFNHACGDAALALRAEHGFELDEIESIIVRVHQNQMPVVCEPLAAKRRPQNEYDAKFSLPYFVAACLVRERFTLTELETASRTDTRILSLCDRTTCEQDAESAFPDYFSGAVEIVLRDGRRLTRREQVNRGTAARPLTSAEIERKFFANAQLVASYEQAAAVRDAVMVLDRAPDLSPLLQALAAS